MAFPARLVELFKTGAALCGPGVSSAGLGGFLGWQPVFFWEHTPKKAGCVGAKAIFFWEQPDLPSFTSQCSL